MLLWEIVWDALPTKEALHKRQPEGELSFVLCSHHYLTYSLTSQSLKTWVYDHYRH